MLPILSLVVLVIATGQIALATTCTLTIPPNPLTATGLATPFILATGCSMAVPGQEVFVEGAVYDPNTNTVSVYNPLVIDQGTQPAAAPVVPVLPTGAVVGLWFGTNAGTLLLAGDLAGGNCVNGFNNNGAVDAFGQFAYCNAPTFFANAANVQLSALGTASDGQPCLTTRDFALVDMDQS